MADNKELDNEKVVKQEVTVDTKDQPKDDKDCTCEEVEIVEEVSDEEVVAITKVFTSENVDLSEEIEMMFNGEEVSEEFKTKVKTILETAIVVRLNKEIEKIEEEAQEAIDTIVEERVSEIQEATNAYLTKTVAEWKEENKVAIETSFKVKLAESLLGDLKSLVEGYSVDLPAEKVNMLEAAQEQIVELQSEVNEISEEKDAIAKELTEMKREKIVKSFFEGLTVTQADKLEKLVAELPAMDLAMFEDKVKILRGSIFVENKEDKTVEKKVVVESNDPMKALEKSLMKLNRKE